MGTPNYCFLVHVQLQLFLHYFINARAANYITGQCTVNGILLFGYIWQFQNGLLFIVSPSTSMYGRETGPSGWQTDENSCLVSSLPMGLNPILNLSILTMYEWWIKRWKSVLSSNVAWSKSLQFNSPAALKLIDGFPADIPSTATIQIGCFMPTNNVKRWIVEEKRCIVLVLRWICGAEHKWRRKMMRTGRSWRWSMQSSSNSERNIQNGCTNLCLLAKHKTTLFCDKKLCSSRYCASSTSKLTGYPNPSSWKLWWSTTNPADHLVSYSF